MSHAQQEKRQLYAVAVERWQKVGRTYHMRGARVEYLHADSSAHARNQFCFSHPNRRTHRVVAVGPTLGYHVNDQDGKILSV